MTQLERSDMANVDHWQTQHYAKDVQAFIARYLEIHDAQARSARLELDRLRSLIDDASERLLTSFSAIRVFSRSCREAASGALDVNTDEIEVAVGSAVSALQFQDMANQLVGHAAQRIELLEKITRSLGRLPNASVGDLKAAVDGTVCGRHTGPVEQACMAGGSVELF